MVHGDWTAGAGLAFFVGCVFFVIAVIEIRRKRSYDVYIANRNPKFVVWYREPYNNSPPGYLAWADDAAGGFYYVASIELAHKFDSAEEALKHAPVYDGSDGIERRTGVARVA